VFTPAHPTACIAQKIKADVGDPPGPNEGYEFCAPQAPLTTVNMVSTLGGTDRLTTVCCKNSVMPQNYDTCDASEFVIGSLNDQGGLWGTGAMMLTWIVPPSPPPPPPPPPPRPPSPPPPR
jgi:hypothetical protein